MIYNAFGTLIKDDKTNINNPIQGNIPSVANQTVSPTLVSGGQSNNYVPGSSGWIIMPNGDCEFGSGNFRGSITGASGTFTGSITGASGVFGGTISANNVTAGTLVGSTVKATGSGSGTDVWIDNDGHIKFFYGGSQYGSIYIDNNYNILYNANTAHQFFNIDTSVQFAQLNTNGLTLPSGKSIQFSSGTTIEDAASECRIDRQVRINGTIYPRYDKTGDCGAGDKRWSSCHAKDFYGTYNDIDLHDRYCPICQQKFELGDFTVLFMYNQPDEVTNSHVPVHFNCMKDYDKSKHQEYVAFIAERNNYYETVEKVADQLQAKAMMEEEEAKELSKSTNDIK
jgi:hypothetical protein